MKRIFTLSTIVLAIILAAACSSYQRLSKLRKQNADGFNIAPLSDVRYDADTSSIYAKQVGLEITDDDLAALQEHDTIQTGELVMKNVRDAETGEEYISDVLMPSLIVSRFAQRQERGGVVPIDFQIKVPNYMISRDWSITLNPELYLVNSHIAQNVYEVLDSSAMESIYLSGDKYRLRQLRGYELYNKYLASIITDSSLFMHQRLLELFIERNMPLIDAFKYDTNYVDESVFFSAFGVSEQEAIEHYSRKLLKWHNDRKIAGKDAAFKRLVKAPIPLNNVKLDTVIASGEDFLYNYSAEISTKGRPTLNKALIYLQGEVYEGDKLIYTIPRTDSLEFTISSVVDFIKDTTMYKVIYVPKHLAANSEYNIVFKQGRYKLDTQLGDNAAQVSEIKSKIRELLHNEKYILDSILVTANASPEGRWEVNEKLSENRSESMIKYFNPFVANLRDSIIRSYRDSVRNGNVAVDIVVEEDEDGNLVEKGLSQKARIDVPRIHFLSKSVPENWAKLEALVESDTLLTVEEKDQFYERLLIANPDTREAKMKKDSYYAKMRDVLYPQLRVVRFEFLLHLKATVQSRVVTDEVDDVYEAGLAAIKNRDWETGIDILRHSYPDDYNLGVAYLMMDRNESARQIFEPLPKTPDVNYMLAIVYMRLGREKQALETFKACYREDRSKYWRGNRDPEIKFLINKYCLPYDPDQTEEDDIYSL